MKDIRAEPDLSRAVDLAIAHLVQAAAPASAPPEELLPPDIEWNLALAGDAKAPFVQAPASAPPEGIAALAVEYHRTVEGEYGCGWPQTQCSGVLRLIELLQRATAPLSSQLAASQKECDRRMEWLEALGIWRQRAEDAVAQLAAFQRREAALREALGAIVDDAVGERRDPLRIVQAELIRAGLAALASPDPEKEPIP